jgi:hypothetical protein
MDKTTPATPPPPPPAGPQLLIPQALAQGIVDYLKARPYAEVHELIGGLLRLPQARIAEGD